MQPVLRWRLHGQAGGQDRLSLAEDVAGDLPLRFSSFACATRPGAYTDLETSEGFRRQVQGLRPGVILNRFRLRASGDREKGLYHYTVRCGLYGDHVLESVGDSDIALCVCTCVCCAQHVGLLSLSPKLATLNP